MGTKKYKTDTKYKLLMVFYSEGMISFSMTTKEVYSDSKCFLRKLLKAYSKESTFASGIILNLEDN